MRAAVDWALRPLGGAHALPSLLRRAAAWAAVALALWTCMELLVTSQHRAEDRRMRSGDPMLDCVPDNEGQWAIGLFRGPSPLELSPLETVSGSGASNPVVTCASVSDVRSGFVADPFIWPSAEDGGKTIHMFYETKSLHSNQGDIGAAVSTDGGSTFSHLAVVLDEPWHLSYPFVVEDGGTMYMVPEGSNSGKLYLYRADAWPTRWVRHQVLIDAPLIDASLLRHDGRWYLFASNRREKSSKNCRELEIWFSDTLTGEWTRHPGSPVKAWLQGSRMAGRPIMHGGHIYRFGQDCALTYGHRVRAFRVLTLDTERYEEEEVPFHVPGRMRAGIDWNALRQHHVDAHELPDGSWVASMDGDKYVSDYMTWRQLRQSAMLLPLAGVLAAAALWLLGRSGVQPREAV